jgi:hypothetical protein
MLGKLTYEIRKKSQKLCTHNQTNGETPVDKQIPMLNQHQCMAYLTLCAAQIAWQTTL